MTTLRTLPAVAVQSSPDFCWVCLGGGRVLARPVPTCEAPDLTGTPIRCPHCAGSADLLELIGVAL